MPRHVTGFPWRVMARVIRPTHPYDPAMTPISARLAFVAASSAAILLASASGCAGRMAAGHVARKALTQHDGAREESYATMDEANMAFYAAINGVCAGNAQGMESVWSHAADVSDFGPDGKTNIGYDAVIARFRREAGMKMGGTVACTDMHTIAGDGFGVVTCVEVCTGSVIDGKPADMRFRATNVFRKEANGWKMVHHHTDLGAPLANR